MATMIRFRVDDADAASLRAWADRLGVDPSELLRDALRAHLVRLSAEADIEAWNRMPLTGGEPALGRVARLGPAEEWSDWSDAAR